MGRWTLGRRGDCWCGCWRGRSSRRWARWWCSVFFAHQLARRALEEELSRRLETAAAGAAATILPEQLRAIGPGDEGSLTYANVRRRLEAARERLGVRRVLAVTPELERARRHARARCSSARGRTSSRPIARRSRARLGGTPAASPLFVGHDGVPYKRAYAAVGEPGEVAGLVAVEGNADYPAVLAAFRRSMILAGIAAAIGVLALTAWIARRISGPVTRLAQAAARLGRGDLDAPVPIETRDEIGVLAQTFDETRAALKARDERMQMMLAGIAHEVRNPLGGLELYAGLLRDALGAQPERLEEVAPDRARGRSPEDGGERVPGVRPPAAAQPRGGGAAAALRRGARADARARAPRRSPSTCRRRCACARTRASCGGCC